MSREQHPARPSRVPICFSRVELHDFRNFEGAVFEPAPRLNVIAGDNGQGKTSLLEALYFAVTTRSFRTDRLSTLVRNGTTQAWVRAEVLEAGKRREQFASVVNGVRRVNLDGKRPKRLLDYALRTPIVAFHPGDLSLVAGASSLRRRLLDRVALFVDPAGYEHKSRYEQAMKERQRALEVRGERSPELDAYEELAGHEGSRYQAARHAAASAIIESVGPAFSELSPGSLRLSTEYRPGGCTEPESFVRELSQRRLRDRVRGAATYGPGRDDLELLLDEHPARTQASQGQQRILTLALKLAELSCIALARGAAPVLLLDDVSSELDPQRTGAVYDVLLGSASQVFVTTTRPDLFPTRSGERDQRSDFSVHSGLLRKLT